MPRLLPAEVDRITRVNLVVGGWEEAAGRCIATWRSAMFASVGKMLRLRRQLLITVIEDAAGAPVTLTEGSWSWSLGMGGVAMGVSSYRHPRRIEIDGKRYPIRDHVMLLKLTAIVTAVVAEFIGKR